MRVGESQTLVLQVDIHHVVDADKKLSPPEPAGSDFEHLGFIGRLAVADPADAPESLRWSLDEEALASSEPVLAAIARAGGTIRIDVGGRLRIHSLRLVCRPAR
jgi:hypothetical protein